MEVEVVNEIGTRADGSKIIKRSFINNDKTNYLVKSQSYFTKTEKKIAKLNHKNNNK